MSQCSVVFARQTNRVGILSACLSSCLLPAEGRDKINMPPSTSRATREAAFEPRVYTAPMCTLLSHVYAFVSRVPHCTHEPSRAKEKRATHMLCSEECEHKQHYHTQSRAAPPHAITSSSNSITTSHLLKRKHEPKADLFRLVHSPVPRGHPHRAGRQMRRVHANRQGTTGERV